jgi:hypothetical protein
VEIPTEPQKLADLLCEHSKDWRTDLEFLEEYAHSIGQEINKRVISNIIIERIEE